VLAHIAGLIVYVNQEHICVSEEANPIRSLLLLNRMFNQTSEILPTIILQRDIGFRCEPNASFEKRESLRQIEEKRFCDLYRKRFSECGIDFGPDELRVLSQPDFRDDEEVYRNTVHDVLICARIIAKGRPRISGTELLALFDTAKTQTMGIKAFGDPCASLYQIFLEVVDGYLQNAMEHTIKLAKQSLTVIDTMSIDELLNYQKHPEIISVKERIKDSFFNRVYQQNPNFMKYSPEQVTENQRKLIVAVDEMIKGQISVKCLQSPKEIFQRLIAEIGNEIEQETDRISEEELSTLPFSILITVKEIEAEAKLKNRVCDLSEGLLDTPEFGMSLISLKTEIGAKIKKLEQETNRKLDEIQKKENRNRQDLEDQHMTQMAPIPEEADNLPENTSNREYQVEPAGFLGAFLSWYTSGKLFPMW
jgi:hypothetical protein